MGQLVLPAAPALVAARRLGVGERLRAPRQAVEVRGQAQRVFAHEVDVARLPPPRPAHAAAASRPRSSWRSASKGDAGGAGGPARAGPPPAPAPPPAARQRSASSMRRTSRVATSSGSTHAAGHRRWASAATTAASGGARRATARMPRKPRSSGTPGCVHVTTKT